MKNLKFIIASFLILFVCSNTFSQEAITYSSKNKNSTLQTYNITIKNPTIDTTIDPTKVVTDITWQQPTYLLEKDDLSRSGYTCDPEKSECRINMIVTPKLDGIESPRLSCRITSDFGIEEDDCNPDTFSVPTGEHTLVIETKNKQT